MEEQKESDFWVKEPESSKRKVIEKGYDKRLKISGFYQFNTSWAKDKEGKKDDDNKALFIEFRNRFNDGDKRVFYWLPTLEEKKHLAKILNMTVEHNMLMDNGGKKFREAQSKWN